MAVVVALSGCTAGAADPQPSSSAPPTSSSPTPSPTPTTDPAIAAAEAAVLEAYRGYWAAKVTSYADPAQQQDPNLARFADDTALTDAQSTIATFRRNGISMLGEPVLTPVITEIQLGEGASATITDCVDATNWQPVYTASGESAAAPDQATRVVTESTAFTAEGRWLIRSSVPHRDTTC